MDSAINHLHGRLESIFEPDRNAKQSFMIRKHSATLHGHRTSFSLEDEFWAELKTIAASRSMPLAALISEIDDHRPADSNLSSALRLHVLAWAKAGGDRQP